MTRKFDEKFANLINHTVPRTFMPNSEAISSDIPTEQLIFENEELTKPPADGFIANYCYEDNR